MYYSLYNGATMKYDTDDEGNIKYIEVDGEQVPIEIELEAGYTPPKEFKALIVSQLSTVRLRAYGVDSSSIYSELLVQKNMLPIDIGTIIWRTSPIEYDDLENRIPRPSSADYTVMGSMTEGLHFDRYLLQKNVSDSK